MEDWGEEKKDLSGSSMMELVEKYKDVRLVKDSLKVQLGKVEDDLKEIEFALITCMESQDVKQLKTTDGSMVSTVEKSYPRIVDKDACYGWLRSNGFFDDLATVNTNTFRAFVNEKIKNGEEVPPGTETFNETKLSLRRG